MVTAPPFSHLVTVMIPPADRCHAWVDFDGTITRGDLLDDLVRRHGVGEDWRAAEAEWAAGHIGSRACLSRQFAAVRATDRQLSDLLAEVVMDPGAVVLFDVLRRAGVPAAVVSDGVDRFIAGVLGPAGLGDAVVRSNAIDRPGGDTMALACPHGRPDCRVAAAHCKCGSIAALTRPGRDRHVYVGDGRSDLCPARRADVVFAKGALATALAGEGVAFLPFDTLDDVATALAAAWGVAASGDTDGRA